jgi:phytoene dehydrogenase-like protein
VSEKSIIIIGAGLAGLATGCYARMNGYRATILEHHSDPGGVAKAWKHDDYLIDGGIHYLMGHRPGAACYEIYRELGVFHNRTYPDLTNYCDFTDEISGQRVSFVNDLEKLSHDLKALAPEDSAAIDDFMAGVRSFQRTDMFGMMETPIELAGIFGPLKQLWHLRRSLRYLGGAYNLPNKEFSERFKNAALRRLLTHLFLPEVPMWFNLLMLSLLANRQMGLLARSCHDFVDSLVERFNGLGGEICYNSTVKEIIVENNRAVGVRLENGTERRADVVVSAGDGTNTIFKLLGGRYVSNAIQERYKNWKQLRPLVTLSFGVRRDFAGESPLRFLLLKEKMTVGNETIDGFPIRIFNYGDKFAPAGRTVFQVLFITDWKYWKDLLQDRPRYEAEKKRVCAEALARLEPHYPGITSQVELTDIATPHTTWRFTLNHEGAFMGWAPTPKALRTIFRKTLPGLENFYMAGQWVVPGGGVPPCFYSGRHVIQILCKRDGKKFSTSMLD